MLNIQNVSTTDINFLELIHELNMDLNLRYGDLQAWFDQHNKTESLDQAVVAYWNDQAVGCGAYRRFDPVSAEIKRMYVRPDFRGKGIADMILSRLEEMAAQNGYRRAILESGDEQPEAVSFYTRCGYSPIGNYGPYEGNPHSICMEKVFVTV